MVRGCSATENENLHFQGLGRAGCVGGWKPRKSEDWNRLEALKKQGFGEI